MTQNRFKSKVVWVAIVSVIVLIANNYGLWQYIGMTSDVFQDLINIVFGILVTLGILNNPTDSQNY